MTPASLGALFVERATALSDRPFVLDPGATTSYGEALDGALRVARRLANAGPFARVAVLLPNGAAFVEALFGALLAGAAAVPIDPRLHPREIRGILDRTGCGALIGPVNELDLPPACAVITTSAIASAAPLPVETLAPDPPDHAPAVILSTSGSTASPKAVVLSHRSLLANVRSFARCYGFDASDVILSALSFQHSFGLTACLLTAIAAGAQLATIDDPQPARVAALASRHGATCFFAVSSFYRYLVHGAAEPADLASVRRFFSGACALPGPVAAGFRERFGVDILQTYGLTEASPIVTATPVGGARSGTVGAALDGVEIRVDDHGELLLRGESVMSGYLDNPAATAAAIDAGGWLRTGDLCRIDEHGYVTILGRSKDLIIRAGAKIFPDEIEEILAAHPTVVEVAVVGMPDPAYEEIPVAFVVPRGAFDPAALAAHCRAALAPFKVPRIFRAIESLPRTPTGKIHKAALRARLAR